MLTCSHAHMLTCSHGWISCDYVYIICAYICVGVRQSPHHTVRQKVRSFDPYLDADVDRYNLYSRELAAYLKCNDIDRERSRKSPFMPNETISPSWRARCLHRGARVRTHFLRGHSAHAATTHCKAAVDELGRAIEAPQNRPLPSARLVS